MEYTGFEIVSLKDLLDRGWKLEDTIGELISLDYETMRGLTKKDEGSLAQWVGVVRKSPETLRMLLDPSGEIVGYWHFLALKERCFAMAKEGMLHDNQINSGAIYSLTKAGVYKAYNVETTLKREFRDTGMVNLLFKSHFYVIEKFAEKGIFFSELCSNAYTKDGEKLCRERGMKRIAKSKSRGGIYWMSFPDFLAKNAKARKNLLELYSKPKAR